jgi:glyoxylase-like metal-dependent hydrolase (beta-lactamase superfamily II)
MPGRARRDVRKIGRRTWLARVSGGALAVWTSLRLGGRDGWAISLGLPETPPAIAQTPDRTARQAADAAAYHRIPLGQAGFTTSYIVVRGDEATIVDTGVAGSAERIGEVVQEAGLTWDAVRHLILTHHHPDHAGSVSDVLNAATGATVWAGAADIPSISAPREIQAAEDGAEIFGLRVLATPGHTLGHISVYDEAAQTLITGDALTNVGGALSPSSPQFSADMTQVAESVRKLAALNVDRALFMHGDPIEGGAGVSIGRIGASLPYDESLLTQIEGPDLDCCRG